jgi:hypothetical protein
MDVTQDSIKICNRAQLPFQGRLTPPASRRASFGSVAQRTEECYESGGHGVDGGANAEQAPVLHRAHRVDQGAVTEGRPQRARREPPPLLHCSKHQHELMNKAGRHRHSKSDTAISLPTSDVIAYRRSGLEIQANEITRAYSNPRVLGVTPET